MNVPEFAEFVKQTPGAALLIGLDGGAAIMNHHRPSVIRDSLLGGAADPGFDPRQISRAWSRVQGYHSRIEFLKTHTQPSDAPTPDARAVECLARLVRAGYVTAVASTDTSMVLFDALHDCGSYGNADRVDCVGSKPAKLEVREHERVFIDAGELLLKGFTSDRHDGMGEDLEKIRKALKNLIGSYPRVYCWGWCDFNLDIKDVCPIKVQPYLTTIGRYTKAWWEHPINEVERDDDPPLLANNDIWYELDQLLFSRPPGSARRGRPSGQPPRRPGSGPPDIERTSLKRPLLSVETLDDLLRNVRDAAVSFIGVESASTRTRCAHWLSTALRQRRQNVLSCSSTDIEDLARFVTMISESKNTDSAWAVGVIGDIPGDAGRWSVTLSPAVRRWRKLAQEKFGQEDYHIVLFVPVAVVDWVTKQFPKERRFWTKSYFTDDFLVLDVLTEWLVENVAPEVDELDSAGAETLARTMVSNPMGPRRADWLHEAVDLWYLEILRRVQGRVSLGDGDGGHEVDLGELVSLWSGVRASYQQVVKELDVDFSLGPAHPRSETSAKGAEEGDPVGDDLLGKITPRAAPVAGDLTPSEDPQDHGSDDIAEDDT